MSAGRNGRDIEAAPSIARMLVRSHDVVTAAAEASSQAGRHQEGADCLCLPGPGTRSQWRA
jgi:hypothetical protein